MRRLSLLALLGVCLVAGAAHAQRMSRPDGTKLLSLCSGATTTECDAYLSGVADAIGALPGGARAACIPNSVTGVQLRDVVNKFLRSHPQDLQRKAGVLTMHIFASAFRCGS